MIAFQTVPDVLASNPWLVVALALVMRAGLAWQRELSWYEYRTLHGLKRLLFPTLDRLEPMGFGLFVTEKGGRDDAEFIATTEGPIRAVAKELRRGGASLHLISSIKRRPGHRGDAYSRAHLVWTDGSTQLEAYLFANRDGSVDIYAHGEASVTAPQDHLEGAQSDGDDSGRIKAAIE